MAVNHMIRFRVSKVQLDRIKFDAKVKGYKTYAAYLRDLALRGDYFMESKMVEISKDVKEILRLVK